MSIASRAGAVLAGLGTALTGAAPAANDQGGTSGDKKDEAAATSTSAGPPRDELRAAADRIRATSRGIVAGFAAVAAIVVGTAPLDKVGSIELWSPAFFIAAGAFGTVIIGIALVIGQAAAVDAPVGASPQQLKLAENRTTPKEKTLRKEHDEIKAAVEWIQAADLVDVRDVPRCRPLRSAVPLGPKPITSLADARDTARDRRAQGQLAIEGEKDPSKRTKLEQETRAGQRVSSASTRS